MDGYVEAESFTAAEAENYKKYIYIRQLYDNQIRIDNEIAELSSEIDSMPQMPENMEAWIGSFRSNFKISDFTKIFKINKKYKKLIEERKNNGRKIKMFAIDNILDQINEVMSER